MDINCGMELHFAETSNLGESDFVSSGTGLSDKLNLGTNTDAVQHLLVLDQVSPPSRSCTDHDNNDKHLSAADFKLDLGPANDLVSAADFPMENSVTGITSDVTAEENSEGYSILNAALEGNPDLKQQNALSRGSISTIPTLPLASILPNLQALQVVPISNLQQLQLLSSGRPITSDSTVAQILSANQKMGQFVQLGSQSANNINNQKIIQLNLLNQQGNTQTLGLSNSNNQKLSSSQCPTDTAKTVQQLINLQAGSSSAFLLGNILVLQPVANQMQGSMSLTQPTVTSLHPSNTVYDGNNIAPLQSSCVASSNMTMICSDTQSLKNIIPRPNICTPVSSCTDTTSGANLSSELPGQGAAPLPTIGDGHHSNGQLSEGNQGETIEDVTSLNEEKSEKDRAISESSINAGRKNTKIVIYGKTISMTFDCRNKNGLISNTKSLPDKTVGNIEGNISSGVCPGSSSATTPAEETSRSVSPSNGTENSSQVKYVSILEPNLSSKSLVKGSTSTYPIIQTATSSLPIQVQNKLDVSRFMQINPIKVNLGASPVTSQGESAQGQGQTIQKTSTDVGNYNSVPAAECEPSKEQTVNDSSQLPMITGGTRHEYKCDLCSASFNRYGNYTRHRMIHTVNTKDDYRYKCGECGRLFLQRCDMKRHMLIHTNEQPFRCDQCGRGYIRRSDLVVHMRFHKKEKTFRCVYCSKYFYQSGDLNRHMRNIHLQTSMLTCGHCSRQFVKEATLIRHMQTKHRDIIIKTLKTKTSPENSENEQEDGSSSMDQEMSSDVAKAEEMNDDMLDDMEMEEIAEISKDMALPRNIVTSSGVLQFKAEILTNEITEQEQS